MSGKSLHDRIIDQLAAYVQKCGYDKVFFGHGGKASQVPAPIVHPIGRRNVSHEYYPDCWAQYRGKVDVYEVWDTETVSSAIEDIVLSALTTGIKYITVICTEQGIDVETANNLCRLILHFMKDTNGKNLVYPGCWKVLKIPQGMWNDDKKIHQVLSKDSWMQC